MNLDAFRSVLAANAGAPIYFMLPDGSFVPEHFHVTEVGRVQKDFIDCGSTVRSTTSCVLQVWVATDLDHRLDTTKLAKVVQLAGALLPDGTVPVEVEYESGAVSQYPVAAAEVTPSGVLFHLGTKHTACLAPDRCGVGPAASGCC